MTERRKRLTQAPAIQKYTRDYLRELRQTGEESLFFFQTALLDDKDLTAEFHGARVCAFLEQVRPGDRFFLVGWRGCIKTSSLIAWLWWVGLYRKFWPDTSCRWIEQKHDLAKAHHERMQDKFKVGRQAALLREMFADRLPPNLEGWTKEQTRLVRDDPNVEPLITIGGLDSALEGGHTHIMMCEDLEGADADTSDVPSEEAEKMVLERAEPLLISPEEGIIGGSGTPHGPKPLVYKVKEDPRFKVLWEPLLDEKGQSKWPQRFSQKWIRGMQAAAETNPRVRRLWRMQYLLRKDSGGVVEFDIDRIRQACYTRTYVAGPGGTSEPAFKYLGTRYELSKEGILQLETYPTQVRVSQLRFYLQIDPRHKDPNQRINKGRWSYWGVHVVGVAPDFHKFVAESWIKSEEEATFDDAIEHILHLYRKWVPYKVTFDPVGAQIWLPKIFEARERMQFRQRLLSLPVPWRQEQTMIPRMSTRMEEAYTGNAPKEEVISSALQPEVANNWLHCHVDQKELLYEFEHFGQEDCEHLDGLDSLAQGHAVWQPHASPEAEQHRIRREMIRQMMARESMYVPPWAA